jgi:hypothetical protein
MTEEKPPLSARFRRVESISPQELQQMRKLFRGFYENADLATFLKDLSEKSGVIMVREKNAEARIRGFSTVKKVELNDNGKRAVGVFSGDTILHPDFWGDRALKDGFVRYMLSVKARMPRTRVYWLLISKGYKTYLLLANNFVTYYPKRGAPADPRLSSLVDQYCEELFPHAYDRARGVLDFGAGSQHLKDPVAPITEEMCAEHPEIGFFAKRNPEWARGVELPCIGEVSLNLIMPYLSKESSRGRSSAPPPRMSSRPPYNPESVRAAASVDSELPSRTLSQAESLASQLAERMAPLAGALRAPKLPSIPTFRPDSLPPPPSSGEFRLDAMQEKQP